ncbi:MAG TPA: hypothetical protein DER01_22705 [Phycisphaerales bacterium]|mgnify:CR=1 FL=1|nr:hypothetical protein [Phycisphaerales bacterium]|tara:strand:- start:1251 stop:2771 length:1521 start_codon:yes stop_codon:yes gene_type:complete
MNDLNVTAGEASHDDPLGLRNQHVPGAVKQLPQASSLSSLMLWGIILFAIGIRLLVFILGPANNFNQAYEPDSRRYVELSKALNEFGTFARGPEDSGVIHIPLYQLRKQRGELEATNKYHLYPETFRTPGYPIFLSIFEWLGVSTPAAVPTQCLLSGLNVLLVFLLARHLLNHNLAAMAAAVIVAVHPADILASQSILSESLFTSLMLSGVCLAVVGYRNMAWAMLGGLLIGAATLVRPISILLGLAIAIWLVVCRREKVAIAAAVCTLVGSMVIPAGWIYRNHQIGLGYQISTVPSINGLFYISTYIDIANAGGDYQKDWPAAVKLRMDQLAQTPEDQNLYSAMNQITKDTITDNPKVYAKLMGRSAFKFFTDHSTGSMMARFGRLYQPTGLKERLLKGDFSLKGIHDPQAFYLAVGWTLWNAAIAGLMVVGCIALLIQRNVKTILLAGGIILYFILTTRLEGVERFRVPVIGLQAILVASLMAWGAVNKTSPKSTDKNKPVDAA